jgi:hypothetical protein
MSVARDTNKSRKAAEARTKRMLARYEVKIALMQSWEGKDDHYVRQLKTEIGKLRAQLAVKGVL